MKAKQLLLLTIINIYGFPYSKHVTSFVPEWNNNDMRLYEIKDIFVEGEVLYTGLLYSFLGVKAVPYVSMQWSANHMFCADNKWKVSDAFYQCGLCWL